MTHPSHMIILILASALALAGVLHADPAPDADQAPTLSAARQHGRSPTGESPPKRHVPGHQPGFPTCVTASTACNTTVESVLTTTDCLTTRGTFFDRWEFEGAAEQGVIIELSSRAFDTELSLAGPSLGVDVRGNHGGGGTVSRIVHVLDQAGTWVIFVGNVVSGQLGDGSYTLRLTCLGDGPPGASPAAPTDLVGRSVSDRRVELSWTDNSDDEEEFRLEMAHDGGAFTDIGAVLADDTDAAILDLEPETAYAFRVRARNGNGTSAYSNVATALTGSTEACARGATHLCLVDGRFKVELDWRDFSDRTGSALVAPPDTPGSGLFYFFDANNWEFLVKVVDGCTFNGSFWVFGAATTNLQYTLRVTDTETGAARQYLNPLGVASPAITDTAAFAACP